VSDYAEITDVLSCDLVGAPISYNFMHFKWVRLSSVNTYTGVWKY
jgi:hypothetical protein